MRTIVNALSLICLGAFVARPTVALAQELVTGIVNANRQFVIRGDGVELAGLDFNSTQGLLLPVPEGTKDPAAPFSFLLSNSNKKITYGNLGNGVVLNGEIVLLAGYAGEAPEKDLTAFWGMGRTQVPFPVSIASTASTTTFVAREGAWSDAANWTAGVPNAKVAARIPQGTVLATNPRVPDPTSASLTIGDAAPEPAQLTVSGHNLRVLGSLIVGTSRGSDVNAALVTNRGEVAAGDVLVGEAATFGVVQAGRGKSAGKASIDGSLIVTPNPGNVDLVVGTNKADGDAVGDLTVRGAIGLPRAAFQDVSIGWNEKNEGGSATGRVVAGQLQSNGNDSLLAVGLNTGQGNASGYLEVAGGILGFSRAVIGVATDRGTADGTLVVGKRFDAESIEIGEVPRDPAGPIRSRGQLIANDAVVQGSSLTVGNGSELIANSLHVKKVVNAGSMAPNRLPNALQGSQLTIDGNLTQLVSGVTRLGVFGPGVRDYDFVRVAGTATLDGRLELNFEENSAPQLGQVFEPFRAEALKLGGIYVSAKGLPGNLALGFDRNPTDTLKFEFVKPEPITFLNPPQGSERWSNPRLWGGGAAPTSIHQINLENRNAGPQAVVVDQNVTVQSIRVAGNSSTMSLSIPANVGFSATHDLTIAQRGSVLLDNGSLAAAALEISSGGVVAGQGQLIGDVYNGGLIQVGLLDRPAALRIDGNYTQSSSGILRVDLAGAASNAFDTLTVTGTADVDGLLQIDIPAGLELEPGLRIPILIATDGIVGGFQLDLPFEDYPDLEFGTIIDGGQYYFVSQSLTSGDLGDMDRNGSVDLCDIDAFAVGMSDFEAYSALYGGDDGITWTPVTRGDINGDGDFDFDDIPSFFELVDGVACSEAASVPEPSGGFVLGWLGVLWGLRQRRELR